MCGIVAFLGKDSLFNTQNALTKIRHRGQDSTKIYHSSTISLGFNRLSINDLSASAMQPFEYEDFVGVFNCEIYNADELRRSFNLETISSSDAEIILPLFKQLGSKIIHYLDGFYSGIIFNKETNQVFTFRDYIGKKPLFYGKTNASEFITSELKSIENMVDFEIVPKGCCGIIHQEISVIEPHKLSYVSKKNLKEVMIEAVKKRIPKQEAKFGVFLSGGLDSSIITTIVSKISDNIIYYSLGSTDTPDLQYVFELSKALNIEDKLKIIPLPQLEDLSELINNIVYHTESYNPSIISNGLATYLLSKAAYNDGLKVVISGEGADELFCGYPISKDKKAWFKKRVELIENMHFTELRRLDLASMANTIEVRCPFLDRNVFSASDDCLIEDLIDRKNGILQGKKILRETFCKDLPLNIIHRNKVSFDVGSGIRKQVVEYLTGLTSTQSERHKLKEIWMTYFPQNLSDNNYFHAYPTFDMSIDKRGCTHK